MLSETSFNSDLNQADIDNSGYRIRAIKSKCNNIANSHRFSLSVNNYTNKPTILFSGIVTQQWNPNDFLLDYADWVPEPVELYLEVEPNAGLNVGKMWYNLRISGTQMLRVGATNRLLLDHGDDMILQGEDA